MKILVAGLKTKPQFLRIKEEAEKRGHVVDGCLPAELVIQGNQQSFEPSIRDGKALSDYDLVYMIVGKRLWEWFTVAKYLNEKYGTIIVNKKAIDPTYNYYQTPAIDYLRQTQNNIAYPKSAILFSPHSVEVITKDFEFPLIVKSSQGHRGENVYKVENTEELTKIVAELTDGAQSCVVREFIPNDGDIRVFCIGYQAIGAMKRTPKEGDFRSNVSQGGSAVRFDLDLRPDIKALAEKTARTMQTEVAGVDVIIDQRNNTPMILEVNPGPQIEGIESTGLNVAGEIVKYFEELYKIKGK